MSSHHFEPRKFEKDFQRGRKAFRKGFPEVCPYSHDPDVVREYLRGWNAGYTKTYYTQRVIEQNIRDKYGR